MRCFESICIIFVLYRNNRSVIKVPSFEHTTTPHPRNHVMLKVILTSAAAIAGGASVVGVNAMSTSSSQQETQQRTQSSSEATLWGIYGEHDLHDCPVNNKQTAEYVVGASKSDLSPLFEKYGVTEIRDRYHSGLEHTFLWAVETERPHDLQAFAIELGLASWNDLTFVPLITFEDGVVPTVANLHGLN
jgi:hypothetical protein